MLLYIDMMCYALLVSACVVALECLRDALRCLALPCVVALECLRDALRCLALPCVVALECLRCNVM